MNILKAIFPSKNSLTFGRKSETQVRAKAIRKSTTLNANANDSDRAVKAGNPSQNRTNSPDKETVSEKKSAGKKDDIW